MATAGAAGASASSAATSASGSAAKVGALPKVPSSGGVLRSASAGRGADPTKADAPAVRERRRKRFMLLFWTARRRVGGVVL